MNPDHGDLRKEKEDLQTKLKITPAQEDLWKKVTEVMRENAQTIARGNCFY